MLPIYAKCLTLPLFLVLFGCLDAYAQPIKVEIKTLKILGGVRNEAMPGVDVAIGGKSVKTDERGRGSIMVEPGTAVSRVTAPCPVYSISAIGSVSRSGGSDQEPVFNFPLPSNVAPSITFLMRCDGDVTPGKSRVKIATTTSCKDDPNGGMAVQGGITVMVGDKQYTSNENGIIDIDLPRGRYPISAHWEDYAFGYVTQNGLRIRGNEGGPPTVNLTDPIETLELRMFTCDNEGREKVRAEIREIGSSASIEVRRSNVSGKGFVGMKLRDGDMVIIRGTAKLKWLERGEIRFEEPTYTTVIKIGPGVAPAGQAARYRPGFVDLIKGMGRFFFPSDPNAVYDENGNRLKFKITGPNAKVFIKGTTFSLSHDEARNTTAVVVHEGVVEVEPIFPGQRPFDLTAGQRAEVSPTSVTAPAVAAPADQPAVRPMKSVFGPNEQIEVEYSNPKASGWDWVVIVQPSRQILAKGPHSSVTAAHAFQFDPNNNSLRDLRSTHSFPPLPEGQYEVRYISWDIGNNLPKASAPFTVGNAPQPPGPPVVAPPTVTPSPFKDLTGLWRNPGGEGIYRVRQIGAKVVWGLDATSLGSVANMFQGQMSGDLIDGVWEDLPGSPTVGGGRMLLKVESECRFVRVSSVNQYGADVWVKKDSPCDRQTGGSAVSPVTALGPLSGLWRNPGGEAVYRFRHIGSKLHWGVDAVPINSFANTFQGEVSGSTIEGSWVDLPGSPAISGGKLSLKIESECRIVKTGEAGHYAAQVWVRKDSLCDVTGIQQETPPQNTTANAPPKVEEIPESEIATKPVATTTATEPRPRVEEIPEDRVAVNKPKQQPRVEEIPEDIVVVSSDIPVSKPKVEEIPQSERPKQSPAAKAQPAPKPAKTPAPKKEGPGIWERLGGALNEAITKQQPQQQPPPTGGTTQQQPDGSCRGGSYWIGAPPVTKSSGFQIAWSSPIGADRHHFRVFRAGTNERVSDNDQPQSANSCGLSWPFYMPPGQYDIYLYPGTFANTWNTSTRPVAGPLRVVVTQ